MITYLEFECNVCGDGVRCKVEVPMDCQGGVPRFTPARCVLSSAMDNECRFVLVNETPLVEKKYIH